MKARDTVRQAGQQFSELEEIAVRNVIRALGKDDFTKQEFIEKAEELGYLRVVVESGRVE